MSILETRNLTYTYGIGTPFEKTAVDNVSINIEEGEFLGIIGHTGSGKSTLIQMFNGLIRPTSGQVLLGGEDIWAKPKEIRKVRFRVGMVFQYPEYQLFEETVLKDVCFGPKNMGLNESQALEKAKEALKFTGLPENLWEKSPFELSGGEKRRAAIAGVIAMDPEVLILDEPAAGLDPMGRDDLLDQLLKYHAARKNTILLVSHSMEDIGKVADRVLVMNGGDAVFLDPTREVFSKGKELREMGLKIPQITHIMQKLKAMGLEVDEGTLKVDDALTQLVPILKQYVKKGGKD
jgi:energy-coupling factor transport system ATP-binding protein